MTDHGNAFDPYVIGGGALNDYVCRTGSGSISRRKGQHRRAFIPKNCARVRAGVTRGISSHSHNLARPPYERYGRTEAHLLRIGRVPGRGDRRRDAVDRDTGNLYVIRRFAGDGDAAVAGDEVRLRELHGQRRTADIDHLLGTGNYIHSELTERGK